jgi:hypothetical protein
MGVSHPVDDVCANPQPRRSSYNSTRAHYQIMAFGGFERGKVAAVYDALHTFRRNSAFQLPKKECISFQYLSDVWWLQAGGNRSL